MKRSMGAMMAMAALFFAITVETLAAELVPVGKVIGLQLRSDTVTVAAFDDTLGGPAREAGLKVGDELVRIGQVPVHSAEDVRTVLEQSHDQVTLTVRRGCKTHTLRLPVQQTRDGQRLGIHLRQGIAGIGTVTWYDPATGAFGTLGHGVSDGAGTLLRMTGGNAYRAQVLSVKRGACGKPGQLRGSADAADVCATLLRNTPQGVFGISRQGWEGIAIPVAAYSDVHPGSAAIRSTVAGDTPREYSVEILKIYPRERSDGRNFLLKVTDPALLAATGGIVQGMSGSPIIQDGKLVGAVTHVLVNDPTTGYGIFIENMLTAAS